MPELHMSIASKIETLAWFARRPPLWGQVLVLAKHKLLPDRDTPELRSRATAWCRERAVSLSELCARLDWPEPGSLRASLGEDRWRTACEAAKSVPGAMGGPGHLDLLYTAVLHTRARTVLETGVAYGWSSLALLEALQQTGGRLVSVDMPYVKEGKESFVGTVVPATLRSNWTLLRLADRQGIPRALRALGGRIDLCHYDSDKSYWGRHWAYPILWQALRPGGVFISDDIQDNFAFDDFAQKHGLSAFVLEYEQKYIGIVKKPSA